MVPGGGHAWLLVRGVHGCWGGACVVAGRGCAWLLVEGACMVAVRGACMVAGGYGGCVWLLVEACVAKGGRAYDATTYGDTINERAVRILLECILVLDILIVSNWNL